MIDTNGENENKSISMCNTIYIEYWCRRILLFRSYRFTWRIFTITRKHWLLCRDRRGESASNKCTWMNVRFHYRNKIFTEFRMRKWLERISFYTHQYELKLYTHFMFFYFLFICYVRTSVSYYVSHAVSNFGQDRFTNVWTFEFKLDKFDFITVSNEYNTLSLDFFWLRSVGYWFLAMIQYLFLDCLSSYIWWRWDVLLLSVITSAPFEFNISLGVGV